MQDNLAKAKELLDIQGSNGNWDYTPYMLGMYNGMELIIAVLEDREPKYKDPPKKYRADETTDDKEKTKRNSWLHRAWSKKK